MSRYHNPFEGSEPAPWRRPLMWAAGGLMMLGVGLGVAKAIPEAVDLVGSAPKAAEAPPQLGMPEAPDHDTMLALGIAGLTNVLFVGAAGAAAVIFTANHPNPSLPNRRPDSIEDLPPEANPPTENS